MIQAYAAKDRIGSQHLSCQDHHPDSILDIPTDAYLPDDADVEMLRHEFCSHRQHSSPAVKHTGYLPPRPERPFHVEFFQNDELVPLGILKNNSLRQERWSTLWGTTINTSLNVLMATHLCYRYGEMALAVSVGMMLMFLYSTLVPAGHACAGWHLQCKSGISANCTWRIYGRHATLQTARETMVLYIICHGADQCWVWCCELHEWSSRLCNIILDGYAMGSVMEFMGTIPEEDEQFLFKANITAHIMDLAFHAPNLTYVVKEPEEDCFVGRKFQMGRRFCAQVKVNVMGECGTTFLAWN